MTRAEVDRFQAALEDKRLELAAEFCRWVRVLAAVEGPPGSSDWIQETSDRDETAGVLSRLASALADIDGSLRAINAGRYADVIELRQPA